jgi:hypothetical protein
MNVWMMAKSLITNLGDFPVGTHRSQNHQAVTHHFGLSTCMLGSTSDYLISDGLQRAIWEFRRPHGSRTITQALPLTLLILQCVLQLPEQYGANHQPDLKYVLGQ